MDSAADAVVLEPAAVARPLLDQRLVRDLDLSFVDGQQPSRDERVDDALRTVDAKDIVQRHATADECAVLAARQPKHDPARDLLVVVGELLVGVLGEAGDRAAYARPSRGRRRSAAYGRRVRSRAGAAWSGGAAARPAAPPVSATSASTSVRSTSRPARPAGTSIARVEVVAVERTHEHLTLAETVGEPRMVGEATVEVGAHRHEHERAA